MAERLLIVVNDAAFFLAHRLPVALAARAAGYDVHLATAPGRGIDTIAVHGFAHHPLPLSRSGWNPLAELRSLLAIHRLFHSLRPRIVHLVTIKPVLYGGIAARLARVPGMVAAISGLGHVFVARGFRAQAMRPDLRVVFENPADRDALVRLARLDPEKARMTAGPGVDLAAYPEMPERTGVPVVLFAARLLRNKGVGEFVAAARIIAARGIPAEFRLAGTLDPGNPQTLTEGEVDALRVEGRVAVLGQRSDMAALIAGAHIVALPTYYGEGMPRILLEAAACGRAVVTTDHPGCRDAIVPGETGLLVPPRDAEALAEAIATLLADGVRRRAMGRSGHRLAVLRFGIESVIASHLAIYRELVDGR